MTNQTLRFSIITPTYNEEKDIRATIESFLALTYANKEILVVDDSTDNTPNIVREYESRGVRLIQGSRNGCCEAVNLGIEEATGDVIINADADVRPPVDFLEKLALKYEAGADWVLVDSDTPNTESVFSRFVAALNIKHYGSGDGKELYYEEAFSCRKDLALRLGMFGPTYPLRFCRDWILGKKLTEGGYKKVYDRSIVVYHPQPDNLKEFWGTRKARGRFGPLKNYFMDNYSLVQICVKLIAKAVRFVLRFILVLPAAYQVLRVSLFSKNKLKDFFPFLWAYFLMEFSRVFGEWEAFFDLVEYKMQSK